MRATLVLLVALAGCKTSIDFEQGRPYACTVDAGEGQCAPGWRCGLSGRCHEMGDAKPWACASNADCEAQWVCGLEGTCHDPTALADYLCTGDEQCVAPWRCGFSGRCLDAQLEAVPFTPGSVGNGVVLQPRFFSGEPEVHVGVVDGLDAIAVGVGHDVRLITPDVVIVLDAGREFDAVLPGNSGDIVIYTDAGTTRINERGPGSSYPRVSERYLPIALDVPRVLDGDQLHVVGGFIDPLPPAAFSVARSGACLFSANASGLFVQGDTAQVATLTRVPHAITLTQFDHTQCASGPQAGFNDVLLRTGGKVRRLLAFTRDPARRTRRPMLADGGEPTFRQYGVYDTTRLTTDPGGVLADGGSPACVPDPSSLPCGDPRLEPVVTGCNLPCEGEDVVVDLRPTDTAIEFECQGRDGTLTTFSKPYDGTCDSVRLFGRPRFVEKRTLAPARFSPGAYLATGAHGQVWWGPSLETANALVTDEPPLGAVQTDAGVIWLGRNYDAHLEPTLGLRALMTSTRVAAVQGRDDLMVTRTANVIRVATDGGPNLRVTSIDALFEESDSALAALAPNTDTLFVARNDSLYIGTRAEWEPSLPLKVVPAPGLKLTSLVPLPGGRRAWVSTSRTVFELTEANGSWTEKPVALPAGAVLEVWTDAAGRSRVAYVDGRVLTLPNGVPLVQPTDGGAPVRDVLAVCDQLWGIVGNTLAHVVADRWQPVEVPLPRANRVLDASLAGGRLFLVDGKIVVFNGAGSALEFTPSPACP